MRKYSFLLFFLIIPAIAFCQKTELISGHVKTSGDKVSLANASVLIVRLSDSIIIDYTRTNQQGIFSLSRVPSGKYYLIVSYPEFLTYSSQINTHDITMPIKVNSIELIKKSILLNEVVVRGNRNVLKFKGDTTEYDVTGIPMQPNANVEDLLKKLPGLKVDQNGKISAHGQVVSRVLVDGEEFFGNDPTLVSKNIRSDMVDKIQLYDAKSDQNNLTGVDDGKRVRTINVKLKETKKQGYFGKAAGGGSAEGYYEGQVMANLFQSSRKIAAFSTRSNTGTVGLGWEDSANFAGTGLTLSESGMISVNNSKDELESLDGRYNGIGLPRSNNNGGFFSSSWNSGKNSFSSSYKAGGMDIDNNKIVLSQNNLPASFLTNQQNQQSFSHYFRHKLNSNLVIRPDSLSTLKFTIEGSVKNSELSSNINSSTLDGFDKKKINEAVTNSMSSGNFSGLDFYSMWSRKFSKKGRTLSAVVNGSLLQTRSSGILRSQIVELDTLSSTGSSQVIGINQTKEKNLKSTFLRANLTYSEPINLKLSGVFSFEQRSIFVNSQDYTHHISSSENLPRVTDDLLSADFNFGQNVSEGGAIFNYKTETILLNFGAKGGFNFYRQQNDLTNQIKESTFYVFTPLANLKYELSKSISIKAVYNGSNVQPTFVQFQPLADNRDPLNTIIGNPDLKPSYKNTFKIDLRSFTKSSGFFIGLLADHTIISNPITYSSETNTAGSSIYKPINMFKNSSISTGTLTFSKSYTKSNFDVSLVFSGDHTSSYNLVNGLINKSIGSSLGTTLGLQKLQAEKYEANLYVSPGYIFSESSLQELNDNGYILRTYGNINVTLPAKIIFNLDGDYTYRAQTKSFDQSFHRFTLNAKILKRFLKSKNLSFSCTAYDLLNQNTGFERTLTGNLLSQTNFTNIKRYVLFSAILDFNKMGGK